MSLRVRLNTQKGKIVLNNHVKDNGSDFDLTDILEDKDKNKKPDTKEENIGDKNMSVSDLNMMIKTLLESSLSPNSLITVVGELSNYKIANKNLFATLKDQESCINLSGWGYAYKKNFVEFANGETVKVTGKVTVYAKTGSYSLIISKIEKIGVGNLHANYELLKQKYNQMGYFDNKKIMPESIDKIGIVTALEGAALQDILYVLKKNDFKGKIVVKSCMAQGNNSAYTIVNGIKYLEKWIDPNDNKKVDIILVTRGGGSFEDLISYSSEDVIEAIHSCSIYTISAVGHEIDFMLSDFVADLRAPTPSISAEIICRAQNKYIDDFYEIKNFVQNNMVVIMRSKLDSYVKIILGLENKLISMDPHNTSYLDENKRFVEKIRITLEKKINNELARLNNLINGLENELSKHDAIKNMNNGYAIVVKGYTVIDSVQNIKSGQKLKIKMRDGDLDVIVS